MLSVAAGNPNRESRITGFGNVAGGAMVDGAGGEGEGRIAGSQRQHRAGGRIGSSLDGVLNRVSGLGPHAREIEVHGVAAVAGLRIGALGKCARRLELHAHDAARGARRGAVEKHQRIGGGGNRRCAAGHQGQKFKVGRHRGEVPRIVVPGGDLHLVIALVLAGRPAQRVHRPEVLNHPEVRNVAAYGHLQTARSQGGRGRAQLAHTKPVPHIARLGIRKRRRSR